MWSIENSNVCYGINHIKLMKDSPLLKDIKILFIENNIKNDINFLIVDNYIEFDIVIKFNTTYKIYIREKNESKVFDLSILEEVTVKEDIDITPTLSYLKGIITLNLFIKNIKSEHKIIIEGDINKTINVSKSISSYDFHYLINDFKIINFKINGIIYSMMVLDRDKFPNKISKISQGIKLNKSSKYDLQINIGDKLINVPKGQIEVPCMWEGIKTFSVYKDDILLFEDTVNRDNYLPEIILLPYPLRVKTGTPSLKNIDIYIKDCNKYFTIKAGDTEVLLNLDLDKGYRTIEIDKVVNATISKKSYTFLIK